MTLAVQIQYSEIYLNANILNKAIFVFYNSYARKILNIFQTYLNMKPKFGELTQYPKCTKSSSESMVEGGE